MKLVRVIAAPLLIFALAACSTHTSPRYSLSPVAQRALVAHRTANVSLGALTGPARAPRCLGDLAPADARDHATYVRGALENELRSAGAYAEGPPKTTLIGDLRKATYDFELTEGTWDLELTLISSNKQTLTVGERYAFRTSTNRELACQQAADALQPAVQNLITKVVQSPRFADLVR